jgi:hypothetical protein
MATETSGSSAASSAHRTLIARSGKTGVTLISGQQFARLRDDRVAVEVVEDVGAVALAELSMSIAERSSGTASRKKAARSRESIISTSAIAASTAAETRGGRSFSSRARHRLKSVPTRPSPALPRGICRQARSRGVLAARGAPGVSPRSRALDVLGAPDLERRQRSAARRSLACRTRGVHEKDGKRLELPFTTAGIIDREQTGVIRQSRQRALGIDTQVKTFPRRPSSPPRGSAAAERASRAMARLRGD